MGIYFEHIDSENLAVVIFHGQVTDAELDEHITRLLKPRYDQPGKRGLVLIGENASSSAISYQAIFDAGSRMKNANFRNKGKLAIVSGNVVGYGLAKVYEAATYMTGLDETRVLKQKMLGEAMQWLGIEHMSRDIVRKLDGFDRPASG